MRSAAEFAMVERLVAEGLNDCDVSRRTGIPRTTIRDWRQAGFEKEELGRLDPGQSHQHDFTGLPPTYAYLLGLYLGDGSIPARPGRLSPSHHPGLRLPGDHRGV
jgi:hypothetical protein